MTQQGDEFLESAKSVRDFEDEVNASNEWVKMRALVGGPSFNILVGNERDNTFQGKTTREFVFEVQFVEDGILSSDKGGVRMGEIVRKGTRANVSLTVDQSRARVYAALRKYGPHGPYWIVKLDRKGKNPYYKLTTKNPEIEEYVGDGDGETDDLPF